MSPEYVNKRVAQAFDRSANRYDEHALLQREVQQRLLSRLDYFDLSPGHILDLGCGTGVACQWLKNRFPKAQVMGLDFAPNMLRLGQNRSRWRRPLHFIQADLRHIPLAAGKVDMLFSSLALQWCDELEAVFAEFRRVLRPGGLLLFSTFGPGTLAELRQAWATVDQLGHVNRFPDMHDVGDAMVRAGFSEPVMDMDMITETYPDVMTLLKSLKAIGADTVLDNYRPGLTGKGRISAMGKAYQEHIRDGRYPASWEVVYGTARAPQPGQPIRQGDLEVASFPIDHLRRGRP